MTVVIVSSEQVDVDENRKVDWAITTSYVSNLAVCVVFFITELVHVTRPTSVISKM